MAVATDIENDVNGLTNSDRFICHQCFGVSFTKKSNFQRHMKRKHGRQLRARNFNLECYVCSTKFRTNVELDSHLANEHEIEVAIDRKTFHSVDDFISWKRSEELTSVSYFRRFRGTHRSKDGSAIDHYVCNRTGAYVGRGKRLIKKSKSIKCGFVCPARMKVVTSELYGGIEIVVDYVSTHLGHDRTDNPRKLRPKNEDKTSLETQFQVLREEAIDKRRSAIVSKLRKLISTVELCPSFEELEIYEGVIDEAMKRFEQVELMRE